MFTPASREVNPPEDMLFVWVAALNGAGNFVCAVATAASASITSNDGIIVNRIDTPGREFGLQYSAARPGGMLAAALNTSRGGSRWCLRGLLAIRRWL